MLAPAIQIVDAHLEYAQHSLFKNFNLNLMGGHWTCLLGRSGVGKSSLLRLIAGLSSAATSANPILTSDGKPLAGRVSYLAQNEVLLPWRSALENVVIGQKLRGKSIDQATIASAQQLLDQVGLKQYAHFYPSKLSGGMKQRVLLARTLFEDKPVILMDEPFASLDVITRTRIQELAARLLQGRTVLFVTHDPMEALRLGHHVYVMSGKPATITSHIELPGQPPRELTDSDLLKTQAQILDTLSHAEE